MSTMLTNLHPYFYLLLRCAKQTEEWWGGLATAQIPVEVLGMSLETQKSWQVRRDFPDTQLGLFLADLYFLDRHRTVKQITIAYGNIPRHTFPNCTHSCMAYNRQYIGDRIPQFAAAMIPTVRSSSLNGSTHPTIHHFSFRGFLLFRDARWLCTVQDCGRCFLLEIGREHYGGWLICTCSCTQHTI